MYSSIVIHANSTLHTGSREPFHASRDKYIDTPFRFPRLGLTTAVRRQKACDQERVGVSATSTHGPNTGLGPLWMSRAAAGLEAGPPLHTVEQRYAELRTSPKGVVFTIHGQGAVCCVLC